MQETEQGDGLEPPPVAVGEQVADRSEVAAVQLVVADPPLEDMVVDRPEVLGEGGVVESAGVDGLQGEVAVDPCQPFAGVPCIDDGEVRPFGDRLAGDPLTATERRVHPRRQPEHRPRRRGAGAVRPDERHQPSVHLAVDELHLHRLQRRTPLGEDAAVRLGHRGRGDAAIDERRRRRAVRQVALPGARPGRLERQRGVVGGHGSPSVMMISSTRSATRSAAWTGSCPMRSTSSRNMDDEQVATMRSTTSARRVAGDRRREAGVDPLPGGRQPRRP